jgi:hypothetical protein
LARLVFLVIHHVDRAIAAPNGACMDISHSEFTVTISL